MYFYPMEFATVIVVTLVKYHNNLYIIEQKITRYYNSIYLEIETA